MDTITIKDLALQTIIGVHAHERVAPQELLLDIAIQFVRERTEDAIDTALDYTDIVARLHTLAASTHDQLIETFAERVAVVSLVHPLAHVVTVTLKKPGALPNAAHAAVTITRYRDAT